MAAKMVFLKVGMTGALSVLQRVVWRVVWRVASKGERMVALKV